MVWNTPQSAVYKSERHVERCNADDLGEAHAHRHDNACANPRADASYEAQTDTCRVCSPSPAKKGLFDDGDMLLIIGLLMILMREKADQKLLFALLLVMLM